MRWGQIQKKVKKKNTYTGTNKLNKQKLYSQT